MKRALATEGRNKAGKPVHRASFYRTQRKIKRLLEIPNKVDADAYVALGRCMEDASDAIVQRWVRMYAPYNREDAKGPRRTLTAGMALEGILSFFSATDEHEQWNKAINDHMDAYFEEHPIDSDNLSADEEGEEEEILF